jgi:CheY-like chemotaxis protein
VAKSTILVAEDNELVRRLLFNILSEDYEVLTAVDGLDAVRVLELHDGRIAAVITDIQMPRMDGFRLVEWLRRNKPGLPILVLSSFCRITVLSALGQKPGLAVLSKPFAVGELEEVLGGLLKR